MSAPAAAPAAEFHAPEGTYVRLGCINAQAGGPASAGAGSTATSGSALPLSATVAAGVQVAASRSTSLPRVTGTCVPARSSGRDTGTPVRTGQDRAFESVLSSQWLDAPASQMREGVSESVLGGSLHNAINRLSMRGNRPKNNLKASGNSLVTRVQTNQDLGRVLAHRTDAVHLTFLIYSRSLLWFAGAGHKAREPTARVSFSAVPTCIDVNQYTRSGDGLDVLVGFASGDVLWIDPVAMRYSRLNKGGVVTNSDVRQVRWLPQSESTFITAHEDGVVLVWDRDGEDTVGVSASDSEHTNGADAPAPAWTAPDASWDSRLSMHVVCPEERTEAGASAQHGARSKGRAASRARQNPVRVWYIARTRIHDMAFSPDLRQLALVAADGLLRIVDLDTETLLHAFQSYFGSLLCTCWSADGRLLLTGGEDDLVSIWAPSEGRLIARAQGNTSFVRGLAFDPWRWQGDDGMYRIISVGEDRRICFFDFSSGALRRPRTTHRSSLVAHPAQSALSLQGVAERSVYVPAQPRDLVPYVEPIATARLPGDLLVGVRVNPAHLLVLHRDGQMDEYARPAAAREMDPSTADVREAETGRESPRPLPRAFSIHGGRNRRSHYFGVSAGG